MASTTAPPTSVGPAPSAARPVLPPVLSVVVGGGVVGEVALEDRPDEVSVASVSLVDLAHAPVLRALLDCRAIMTGAGSVVVAVPAGEAGAAAAAVVAEGYETASARLRLDLVTARSDAPAHDPVSLDAMTAEEFATFRAVLADTYAQDRMTSGESAEQAREVADAQLVQLLPHGVHSDDQHLFTARAGGAVVGRLWIGTDRPGAFVHDVEVVEGRRRQGHGSAIMRAAAHWAREQGADELRLDVFGHNTAAQALYERLGFEVADATWRRVVSPR